MKNLRKVLFISFITLFALIGCSQKTETVNEVQNTSVEVEKGTQNDFINELALHDAVRAKDKSLVDELISKGVKVNTQDKYGYTPLHLAARLNQLDIAEKLFASGASINNTDKFGDTPLIDSTRNSTNAMSRFLICNGAERNVQDKHEMTPLHNASKNNDLYIAMMLQTQDITSLCEKLTITLEYYDDVDNKICGNIPTGVATNIDVTLAEDSEDSVKPMGPFKAQIDEKTYCAKLNKPLKSGADYLVTAIGSNDIDKAIATANLSDIKLTKEEPKDEYIEGLYEALMTEFGPDFGPWNAELDKNGLVFRFKDPTVLFKRGSSELRTKYTEILDNFFPRYLKVLDRYVDQIAAVRVEGHTSSEFRTAKSDEERYSKNKALSENRAKQVFDYTQNMTNDKEVKANSSWLEKVYSYHGMAYDDLIYDENGVEDKVQSRRVEFRINKIMN
ncbi:ankyrin repeat domain-containing protein [Campylobacterota bacterium DY0563]